MRRKTFGILHLSTALNIIMIFLIFVMIGFAVYFKHGIQIKITSASVWNSAENMIVLDEKGNIYLGKEKISFIDLQKKFKMLKKNKYTGCVICPSSAVKINQVEKIVDAAKNEGIKNITIQTKLALF